METYPTCNLLATYRLVEACRTVGDRTVHPDLDVVGLRRRGRRRRDRKPLQPISPYGVTKLAAEQLILAYVRDLRVPGRDPALLLHLRPAPAPRHGLPPVHRGAASTAATSRSSATAEQTRSSTFVSDAVDGDRGGASRRPRSGRSTTSVAASGSSCSRSSDHRRGARRRTGHPVRAQPSPGTSDTPARSRARPSERSATGRRSRRPTACAPRSPGSVGCALRRARGRFLRPG